MSGVVRGVLDELEERMNKMDHRKYNPDLFTRRSLRLPDRDYAATNAYFVTIRAKQLEPIFEAPELRKILLETWQALPERFHGVTLDEFVVMPDHIHFILWLDSKIENVPTLGSVVGAYKSLTTVAWLRHIKSAGLERSGLIWQRNYYERVVRIEELEKTRQYIRNNPTELQRQTENQRTEM